MHSKRGTNIEVVIAICEMLKYGSLGILFQTHLQSRVGYWNAMWTGNRLPGIHLDTYTGEQNPPGLPCVETPAIEINIPLVSSRGAFIIILTPPSCATTPINSFPDCSSGSGASTPTIISRVSQLKHYRGGGKGMV